MCPKAKRRKTAGRLALALLLCFLAVSWPAARVLAQSINECATDSDCETLRRPGSKCLEFTSDSGSRLKCSNPYLSGCLSNHVRYSSEEGSSNNYTRACNSDDTSGEYCQYSALNYTEIRVHNGNWESVIFYSWIIQIFLSEFLHVPVRVGLGPDTPQASFYNPDGEMSWSTQAYAFEEIETANRLGGHCELTKEPCVHVLPEVWIGQEQKWRQALLAGEIDQSYDDGQIGKISWYIPAFTAERFPEFITYHGLAGRRELLAETFQSPTTFETYCRDVSPTKCQVPDDVAERAPVVGEEDTYFQTGIFKGYFQTKPENNCTLNPSTCVGHIVGAPCTWSTNVDAQAYWNDIALRSMGNDGHNGGYSYGQMIQIWRAANATKSHVAFWWWTPDATIEEFRGTDFEFQRVLLPDPTSHCRASRIAPEDRCSEDLETRQGGPNGACDNEVNSLQKVVASSLRDLNLDIPKADRSPGFDAIKNIKVTHLAMNIMLREWVDGDRTGFAARDAVCKWVVEHREELASFIPRGYPRVIVGETGYQGAAFAVAIAIGALSAFCVVVCFYFVYRWRKVAILYHAQFSVNALILLGLFLVSIGAVTQALEPKDQICVSQIWFISIGYTLELVPLLVKAAAINSMMLAKERRRRAYLRPRDLALPIVPILLIVISVLSIWTVLDPPQYTESKRLIEDENINIVQRSVSCSSESIAWVVIALSWEGLIILWATVLAFQSRKVKREFNKTTNLGLMIYSHFVLFILRVLVFEVGNQMVKSGNDSLDPATVSTVLSYLLSLDVLTALGIYMVPKLIAASTGTEISQPQEDDFSSDRSSLRDSLREVGSSSSRAVQEIVAKAHMAMAEYKESQKSSEFSASFRRNQRMENHRSSFSMASRRSSASIGELPDIQEEEKEEERAPRETPKAHETLQWGYS